MLAYPRVAFAASLSVAVILAAACSGGGGGDDDDDDDDDGVTYAPAPNDVRVTAGAELGISATPRIAACGGALYAVWTEQRGGNEDILFNRSVDGGLTWGAANAQLDTDGAGAASSTIPQIVCDQSRVFVVWKDERSNHDIYANLSTNGGVTWLAQDLQLNEMIIRTGNPRIALSGANVYAVWENGDFGAQDIHFDRSTDGGASWQAFDVRLDTDAVVAARSARIAASGVHVFVAWEGDGDVYFNHSGDSGTTWDGETRVDATASGTTNEVQLAVCDDVAIVAWTDAGPEGGVYANRTPDFGATWLPADVSLSNSPPDVSDAVLGLACAGSRVHAVWMDTRNGAADVFANSSADGGVTWLAGGDIRLDTDVPGEAASLYPALAATGDLAFVVWEEMRDPAFTGNDVHFSWSADGGQSWASSDLRVNATQTNQGSSRWPQLAEAGGIVHVVWSDGRDGNDDIYSNFLE